MDVFTADYLSNLTAELSAPLIAKASRRFKEVWSGDEMDQALFLEQQIERFLRIDDQRVSGEVAR